MAGILAGGGKSRGGGESGTNVLPFIEGKIDPSFQPIFEQQLQQLSEAQRTGGVGAQIPIIQQALSQSRSALGQSQQQTANELTRAGLGGTPFEQRTLAEGRRAGEQQIAGIAPQFAREFTGQIPQLILGLMPAMLGAVASISGSRQRSGPFST